MRSTEATAATCALRDQAGRGMGVRTDRQRTRVVEAMDVQSIALAVPSTSVTRTLAVSARARVAVALVRSAVVGRVECAWQTYGAGVAVGGGEVEAEVEVEAKLRSPSAARRVGAYADAPPPRRAAAAAM